MLPPLECLTLCITRGSVATGVHFLSDVCDVDTEPWLWVQLDGSARIWPPIRKLVDGWRLQSHRVSAEALATDLACTLHSLHTI